MLALSNADTDLTFCTGASLRLLTQVKTDLSPDVCASVLCDSEAVREGGGTNKMDNWHMTWQLARNRNAELLDSVQRYRRFRQQAPRISWPRRLAVALALLGMR
jgi:hypothetical protein